MKQIILMSCIVLLSACGSYRHNELEVGIKYFKAGHYRQAYLRLKPEAEEGQRDAQYAVGYMYYYGQGVVEDRNQAHYWICKAAHAGQPEAIEALKRIKQLG